MKIKKSDDGSSLQNSRTMLDQIVDSMLDHKTNEDFNNEHPDHDEHNLTEDSPLKETKDIVAKNKMPEPLITYTCPMHPEVISDKQGKCPICGMRLVEKK